MKRSEEKQRKPFKRGISEIFSQHSLSFPPQRPSKDVRDDKTLNFFLLSF
jgi:hypothetical protein